MQCPKVMHPNWPLSLISWFSLILCRLGCLDAAVSDVECLSPYSCSGEFMNVSGIYAYGYKSLTGGNTTVNATQSIFCDGAYSCSEILSMRGRYTYCQAESSCLNIKDGIVAEYGMRCTGLW